MTPQAAKKGAAPTKGGKKKANTFVMDCGKPVEDKIMDIASFEKFLLDRIKVGLDIHLVEVEVPEDQLMLGKVNSNIIQWHQLPPLLATGERLQDHFERFLGRFLQGNLNTTPALPPPACLITDMLLEWSSAVAQKFGIPRVNFETSGMFSESIQQIVWDLLPRNLART